MTPQEPTAAAIITAGGIGRRMGSATPKQYLRLHASPILIHTLNTFIQTTLFQQIIVVVPGDFIEETKKLLLDYKLASQCQLASGGQTRQDSVRNGLDQVAAHITHVAVHDGVRPLVTKHIIKNCLLTAYESGAAISAISVKDTLKESRDGLVIAGTVPRKQLWRAQTPQAFKIDLLKAAYEKADACRFSGTDEASLLELLPCEVKLVEGSETNIKITLPEDIPMAEAILNSQGIHPAPSFCIGHGFDAHRLVPNRPLILGGEPIAHPKGLLGHSDADVLTHALCDAILGALGEGDIGYHFPDNLAQYKDANSLDLLQTVIALCHKKNYRLNNADITLIAQQPKIAPHLHKMKENLSKACKVSASTINIKATTTEKMGFTGREEGISCHAVVSLQQISTNTQG